MTKTQNLIFGFDIGTRSIVGVAAVNEFQEKDRFKVVAAHVEYHSSRSMMDGQIQDINEVAKTIFKVKKALELKVNQPITEAYVAAAGRVLQTVITEVEECFEEDVTVSREMISSLELIALEKAKQEVSGSSQENYYGIGHSVMKYFLNGYEIGNLLDQKAHKIGMRILATFLPAEVVESLYQVMEKADMKIAYLTLEPIAASQIAIPSSFRLLNIALVDVGAGTSDIAITSGGTITAYGMIPIAGDEITESIIQQYLVDFDTAEQMKIHSTTAEKEIAYVDIMELEQSVGVEDFIRSIGEVTEDLTSKIVEKIVSLNGDRVPNAVFIVGGGGQVKGFAKSLADKIGLPESRVSLRGKESLKEVEVLDDTFKKTPEFVTPIGICYKGLADSRQDFIQVYLNEKPVRLFNKKNLTIMDIMASEGVDPRHFLKTKGSSLEFFFNGKAYLLEGEYGEVADIYKNHDKAVLSDKVEHGDYIYFSDAKRGKNAKTTVIDFMVGHLGYPEQEILEDRYYITVNGSLLAGYYQLIQEKDKIFCRLRKEEDEWYAVSKEQNNEIETSPKHVVDHSWVDVLAEQKNKSDAEESLPDVARDIEQSDSSINNIPASLYVSEPSPNLNCQITVNQRTINLFGKEEYIFVDVFDYIEFDRSQVKGKLVLKRNGVAASYIDPLEENDVLEIYWE